MREKSSISTRSREKVGLIIADLRVGDHAAHGKFFKRAKGALGVRGALIVDMPEEYYSKPNEYWQEVWRAVNPNFVFLGETNHPLQEVYESQARRLGGIILIDPAPVIQRSGDLLKLECPE